MKRIGITLGLVATLLLIAPGMASAVGPQKSRPSCGLIVLDLLFIRPLSLATPIGATALTVLAYPFALPFGVDHANEMADAMIGGAWRFTFVRPLGDFSD